MTVCTLVFVDREGSIRIPHEETIEDWDVVRRGAWSVEREDDWAGSDLWTAVYRVERRGRAYRYLVAELEEVLP